MGSGERFGLPARAWGRAVHRFVTGLIKIVLASLLAGSLLSFLGITADSILLFLGLTPEQIWSGLQAMVAWASPRIVLGAAIVLPVWFITYILMPPGDG